MEEHEEEVGDCPSQSSYNSLDGKEEDEDEEEGGSPSNSKRGKGKGEGEVEGRRLEREEWSEVATLVLLEVWGSKIKEEGSKSLSLQDWIYVANQVTLRGKVFKTAAQCRNRIDTLKKKYKHEKRKQGSNWFYYGHMEALLNVKPSHPSLPYAVDAGRIIKMKSRKLAYHSLSSTSQGAKVNNNPGVSGGNMGDRNPCKRKLKDLSIRILTKAIQRLGEIYEKVESAKRRQLVDLESARLEFTREFETQKLRLLRKTQAELAEIRQEKNETDLSASD